MSRKVTSEEMENAYKIFGGNFFEGSWMGNDELDAAMVNWAKKDKPDIYEMDETKEGVIMEMLVKDEEVEGEMAGFINSLPKELKDEALEGICEDLESMEDDEAESLIESFRAIIEEEE